MADALECRTKIERRIQKLKQYTACTIRNNKVSAYFRDTRSYTVLTIFLSKGATFEKIYMLYTYNNFSHVSQILSI